MLDLFKIMITLGLQTGTQTHVNVSACTFEFFFFKSVNGIPEPVLVGKRCSTANTGAAILLVHSGSGPLCVNKIELVLWFIYSFKHLGSF